MAKRRARHAVEEDGAANGAANNGLEKRQKRQPLDLQGIVREALALLDEAGLDSLSMRNLAERLGIKAASLYWYVRDKDELLGLLADAISGEARAPALGLPWRPQLEALLEESRRILLAHRDAARIMVETPPFTPNRLRLIDMTFQALLAAGFTGAEVLRVGRLLNDYVTSFVLEEYNELNMAAGLGANGAANIEAAETAAQRQFAALPADTYPAIAAVAAHAADPDLDARFRFGLKVVLDGLERQLATDNAHKSVYQNPRPG